MEHFMPEITPNFIKNKKGKDIGVFIDIQDYRTILERMEDLYLTSISRVIKSKDEDTKSLDEVKKDLSDKD